MKCFDLIRLKLLLKRGPYPKQCKQGNALNQSTHEVLVVEPASELDLFDSVGFCGKAL